MLELFSQLRRGWRSAGRRSRSICSALLLGVLSLALLGALALSGVSATPAQAQANAPPSTPAEVDALKMESEGLKARAERLKDVEEDLKWILGFIFGAAVVFSFAQGFSTWFSADTFKNQANEILSNTNRSAADTLSKIEQNAGQAIGDIKTRAAELKEKYPLFSEEEERRKEAFDDLRRIFPDEAFNWQRDDYEKMPVFERQKLLSIERFISYEIAGNQDPDEVYARRLRRLARFYWSKFIYERKHGSGNYADLDRAEYLVDLAKRRIASAFYLLNDLGNIYIERARAFSSSIPPERRTKENEVQFRGILTAAEEKFRDSVEAQKAQLRAYFNLAIVETRLRDSDDTRELGLHKAIGHLRQGLKLAKGAKYPNWENEPVKEYYGSALYNLACYHARLFRIYKGQALRSMAAAKACEAVLRKTARIGMATPEDVAGDFDKDDGDFSPILKSATPEIRKRFDDFREELLRNSARK